MVSISDVAPGDVLRDIWVDYADEDAGKERPAVVLVVENDAGRVGVLPVYSRRNKTYRPDALAIEDWAQAGLDHLSYIDTDNMLYLTALRLGDDVTLAGHLSDTDLVRLVDKLSD
ncbi:MAG: type II toxin-antitoxin system PemK/MazF family toxin [Coriobacteriales bacterium]|jgi:hypothetical protein|nr:type II toxin-antitoxin system PemK/MazF family toxin [Coriobacteriales bacterium]